MAHTPFPAITRTPLTPLAAKHMTWWLEIYIQMRMRIGRYLYPQPRSHPGSYGDKAVRISSRSVLKRSSMAEVKTMRFPFPVCIAAYPSGAKGLDVEEP